MIEINNSNTTASTATPTTSTATTDPDKTGSVEQLLSALTTADDEVRNDNLSYHVDVTNTSSTSALNDSHDSNISSSSSGSLGTTTADEQQVNKIKIEDSVFNEEVDTLDCEPTANEINNDTIPIETSVPIENTSNTCNGEQSFLSNVQIFQRSPIFEKLKPPAMKEHVNTFPKLEKITPLEMEWMEQVMAWNTAQRDCNRLCRLGIPPRLRGFIWRLCSGAIELEKKNIGVYHFFLTKQSDEYEYKISKDIARTFPKVEQFSKEQGQIALFNILKAYSVMDPEIGYTQGMSFIAAVLLSSMDEIESFWTFTGILKNYKLSTLYSNDLTLLKKYLYVIDRLIELLLPKLFSHLKEIGVTPVLFASEWISTLFTYNFNLDISVRFWDVFFVCGRFYLHRLVIAILSVYERQLLQADFESAVEFLKKVGTIINPDQVIQVADSIQITTAKIEELENEYDHPDCGPSDYF